MIDPVVSGVAGSYQRDVYAGGYRPGGAYGASSRGDSGAADGLSPLPGSTAAAVPAAGGDAGQGMPRYAGYSRQRQEAGGPLSDVLRLLKPGDERDRVGGQEDGQASQGAESVPGDRECQTCQNRQYQDGSDDSGVSYQTPTKIPADQAASAVRSHENEHVVRERDKARREGRKVVSQSVMIKTAICPECGRVYVSGGVTRTVTRNDDKRRELFRAGQPDQPQGALINRRV
ncbi:MAG: hypothetical protein LBK98_04620 [Peptococcaceae bacterium]|jgi:hypothetical protein|nr:hypothetical protein [Peptococcaceae bacterium]